jgi:hypothetical protein
VTLVDHLLEGNLARIKLLTFTRAAIPELAYRTAGTTQDGVGVVRFGSFPQDHTLFDPSAKSVRNPLMHLWDDAIAMRSVRKSASSKAMNRNGCNPIRAAEHGLSSSAMPSTGPAWVENITSTTAPGLSGLRTRSKPPVTETV